MIKIKGVQGLRVISVSPRVVVSQYCAHSCTATHIHSHTLMHTTKQALARQLIQKQVYKQRNIACAHAYIETTRLHTHRDTHSHTHTHHSTHTLLTLHTRARAHTQSIHTLHTLHTHTHYAHTDRHKLHIRTKHTSTHAQHPSPPLRRKRIQYILIR